MFLKSQNECRVSEMVMSRERVGERFGKVKELCVKKYTTPKGVLIDKSLSSALTTPEHKLRSRTVMRLDGVASPELDSSSTGRCVKQLMDIPFGR